MKVLARLACMLLCTTMLIAQQPKVTHNGTWWRDKSPLYKEAFVNGFKSGARSTAGHDTPLSPFGTTELVDGVDKFYKDFRNRNILFNDAMTFVADQLGGMSDDKLNTELLKARAAAAASTPVE